MKILVQCMIVLRYLCNSHYGNVLVDRVVMWWRTKQADNIIKGYKVNLQHALGTRIPNGILNFFFKFSYGRKVCDDVRIYKFHLVFLSLLSRYRYSFF